MARKTKAAAPTAPPAEEASPSPLSDAQPEKAAPEAAVTKPAATNAQLATGPAHQAFLASLSPQQRQLYALSLAEPLEPPKPIVKKRFRLVATRLGFDGITRRHPGDAFEMDININDEWPSWVVKEEDYEAPAPEPQNAGKQPGVRGWVAGQSVI